MSSSRIALLAAIGAAVFIALAALDKVASVTAVSGVVACVLLIVIARRAPATSVAAARFATAALVVHAALVAWAAISAKLDSERAVAAALALQILVGGAVTVALGAIAAAESTPIALAGAVSWTLGWGLGSAMPVWLVVWLLSSHPIGELPHLGLAPALLRLTGGLVLGAALLPQIRDSGSRRIALVALALFGALSIVLVLAERSLLAAVDVAAAEPRRLLRDGAVAASSIALAVFVAMYRRARGTEPVPRAVVER